MDQYSMKRMRMKVCFGAYGAGRSGRQS